MPEGYSRVAPKLHAGNPLGLGRARATGRGMCRDTAPLALIGHGNPPFVVIERDHGGPIQEGSGFDWELWALILTGLGTTALAVATGLLALSTWRDVRASQEIAREAVAANELARAEQARLLGAAAAAALAVALLAWTTLAPAVDGQDRHGHHHGSLEQR